MIDVPVEAGGVVEGSSVVGTMVVFLSRGGISKPYWSSRASRSSRDIGRVQL